MPTQTTSSNNKRIAKNTVFMYFRMFITMAVSLYTSRVVFRMLGVADYGLYNVIGGVIAMFGFLNYAMTNTTSRYITFYLGRNDENMLKNIFSMSFIIHAAIAIIIIIIGETVGLWYVYEKLVVPEGRFSAALWLYQLSIASTVLSILYVPFNSTIIAHEKMGAFAYISILDAVLKLLIVFALVWAPYDKLIFYGTLNFGVNVLDLAIYIIYSKLHFEETNLKWFWDKLLFKEMFSFTGWNILGNFSFVFYTQGLNLILNFFCGPAVNAARGIAVSIESVVKQFSINVQTAINPQIIKSFAEGDKVRMQKLIYSSSRCCFFLIFLVMLPVIMETPFILKLWLGKYPDHCVNFVLLTLIISIFDTQNNPLFTANVASGNIKKYQTGFCTVTFLFMPITYIAMKHTNIPEMVFYVAIVMNVIALIVRIIVTKNNVGLNYLEYINKVVVREVSVVVISIIPPLFLENYMHPSIYRFIVVTIVCVLTTIISIYILGLTKEEKVYIYAIIKKKIQKK